MDYLRRSAVFTSCLYLVSAIVLAVYNTKYYTEHEFDIVDLIGIEHYCNQTATLCSIFAILSIISTPVFLITIQVDKRCWLIASIVISGVTFTTGSFAIFYFGKCYIYWLEKMRYWAKILGVSQVQWGRIGTTHWPALHRELFDELSPMGNSTWDKLQKKYQWLWWPYVLNF